MSRAVKRVEIVIGMPELDAALRAMSLAGIKSYSILHDVTGMGDRGPREGDQPSDVGNNVMILIACDYEESKRLADNIRPVLKRYGGMCLVSDAVWVEH